MDLQRHLLIYFIWKCDFEDCGHLLKILFPKIALRIASGIPGGSAKNDDMINIDCTLLKVVLQIKLFSFYRIEDSTSPSMVMTPLNGQSNLVHKAKTLIKEPNLRSHSSI